MHSFLMTILCAATFYPSAFGLYFRSFPLESESKTSVFNSTSAEIHNLILDTLNDTTETNNNLSEHRDNAGASYRIEVSNSSFTSSSQVRSTKNIPYTQSTPIEITLTEIFSDESNSTSSVQNFTNSPSSSAGGIKPGTKSTSLSTNEGTITSSTENEDQEGVVRGKPTSTENSNTTTSKSETIYQKALSLINDTYTLSILIPVAAGILFASTILVTIATCRCLRRLCRRRRLRKKILPDSVKNLRPSDRARLLAESSDEEF